MEEATQIAFDGIFKCRKPQNFPQFRPKPPAALVLILLANDRFSN